MCIALIRTKTNAILIVLRPFKILKQYFSVDKRIYSKFGIAKNNIIFFCIRLDYE